MKRLTLILGAAALAAISAPFSSAQAQTGCSWWDLTCNGMASRVSDYAWHIAGRDQAGNVVYLRRSVDSNGNVIFEQSRRNDLGRYLIVNNHTIRKGTVYGANGELCKYTETDRGYKEQCKYAKVNNVYWPSKVRTTRVKPVKYQAPKAIHYQAPKAIHYDADVKGAKPHAVDAHAANVHAANVHAAKVHEAKGKGPKH